MLVVTLNQYTLQKSPISISLLHTHTQNLNKFYQRNSARVKVKQSAYIMSSKVFPKQHSILRHSRLLFASFCSCTLSLNLHVIKLFPSFLPSSSQLITLHILIGTALSSTYSSFHIHLLFKHLTKN